MSAGARVAVRASVPEFAGRARRLAEALSAPLLDSRARECDMDLVLVVDGSGVGMREPAARTVVRADFSLVARPGVNLSRRQPLARAMGRGSQSVVDATAGLGQDAALLAAMGFHVLAVERSPVLSALLDDAVQRAAAAHDVAAVLGGRLALRLGVDARRVLEDQPEPPDVVYIDPMFPPKRRASTLAKRPIRLVRTLVGDDDDAPALLAVARAHALRRVVVKRPDDAPPLEGPAPASSIGGKLVRYDIYPVAVNR